jgi:hypothetical protein
MLSVLSFHSLIPFKEKFTACMSYVNNLLFIHSAVQRLTPVLLQPTDGIDKQIMY